jgi:hypothetical protein
MKCKKLFSLSLSLSLSSNFQENKLKKKRSLRHNMERFFMKGELNPYDERIVQLFGSCRFLRKKDNSQKNLVIHSSSYIGQKRKHFLCEASKILRKRFLKKKGITLI